MEKKQNFPSHAGLSGKALIASLFIISGILLFARNVGWITYDLFSIVVSWHSLLIVLGIYTMTRRHYLSGSILTLIGVYFLELTDLCLACCTDCGRYPVLCKIPP